MAKNDKQIKKLSEEIKGTLKSLFEVDIPGQVPNSDPLAPAAGQDPLADPNADPLADPLADPMAQGADPLADPMAQDAGMGMDALNGGAPGEEDPMSPEGGDVPVPETDQANLNNIPEAPAGETEPQKVQPEPNVNILGTENRDQTANPLPNFVAEAFGGEEKANQVINYLVERVVMNYHVKKGANTTHGEQELHDVIIEKLAKFLEKKQDEFSSDNVDLRKELAGVEEKSNKALEENVQIKEKYITLLREFSEVLAESHSYLKRNELNWKVFGLAISDQRKAQAIREMSSLSLAESEQYLKRLQKLEESSSPSAQPRRYNTAETAKLREFVKGRATEQDEAKKKPINEEQQGSWNRVLRNAGVLEDED